LVALHRRREGAAAAVTFFTTSVVATALSLLGAALLYMRSGSVHLPSVMSEDLAGSGPLGIVGLVLLLAGFGFKVAAVPLHAWAPSTYDGAPVPVAAYLSTASKLGGVIALVVVARAAVDNGLRVPTGVTLAVLATASLIIGTLVALRQQRTVRLLAWSSVAQAGFILAPLGGLILSDSKELFTAALAYTMFFLALEIGAFGGLVSLRPREDGGTLDDLTGLGRAAPWRSAMLAIALIGLAGLPPVLAGLFAKITVIQALLEVDTLWLALVVALISVVGLAVYWRPLAALYRGSVDERPAVRFWPVIPLAVASVLTGVLSVAPQLTFSLQP
jgi:NADH-quinone oxidoreductase subunit N